MLSRRHFLIAAGTALGATGASTAGETVQIGLMQLELPDGVAPVEPGDGWDWAAAGPDDVLLQVRGRTTFPTPDMALADLLAPGADGRFTWSVTGHPPQPVPGADAYSVLDVASVQDDRRGVLLAGTLGAETAVLALSGAADWSPSLRRTLLSRIEVRDAS